MKILSLSGVPRSLLEGIIKVCKLNPIKVIKKTFPDGEQYIRILDNSNKDVIVLQSLYPDQDKKIIELYLALEALRGIKARIESLVIPYIAYSRQDKRFLEGEPISVKALYEPLKRVFNIDTIVTVDVHSVTPFKDMGFNVINILPHTYMISQINERIDIILAPDKGALNRAREVAQKYGIAYDFLEKYRDRITGQIRINEKELDVKDKVVAIVDDIVSTGSTLAKAVEVLYRAGAKEVIAVVSHALLIGKAKELLEHSGLKLLVTSNSIEHKFDISWIRVVDISSLICNFIC